jgi:hypothetical protein
MEGFLPLYDISVTNALLYLHQKNKKPQGRKRKPAKKKSSGN